MAQIRKTQLNLVVGINGTGKTTFLRQQVVERQKKALVVTPYDYEWQHLPTISTAREIHSMVGAARLVYKNYADIENVTRYYYGGALIFDDAMFYLHNRTEDELRQLYISRRQFGRDIYIVTHGLRQMPPQCFTFASFLILFASTENFSVRKKELDEEIFARILKAQRELNAKCRAGNPYGYKIIKLDPAI